MSVCAHNTHFGDVMKVREAREREKSHILLTGSHKSQTAAWQDYVVKHKSARVCVCMCVHVRVMVCSPHNQHRLALVVE